MTDLLPYLSMKEETQKELKEKLNGVVNQIHKDGEVFLDQTRGLIQNELKELVSLYSKETRNLAIISGTVAPFSLTLLGLEKLNINAAILLLGFSILLLNIVLAQYFIFSLSKRHDHKVNRAMVNQILAEGTLPQIGSDTVSAIPDYLGNVDELGKWLSLNKGRLDLELTQTRKDIKIYYLFVIGFFTAGTVAIVSSVVINPISKFVLSCF